MNIHRSPYACASVQESLVIRRATVDSESDVER